MGREYTSPLFSTDNQYLKYYIYVWEDSTNVINNTSHMSVSVIALRTNTGYTTNYGGGCAIKLDGVEQASQYWDWGEKPVSYESYTTLYETSYWDQAHDSNGTKTMNIAASCWWYSNGSVYIDSAWQSFNVTLTAIDRGAPTVTISTSNVGVNSFSLSASTGSTTCDVWQRSIDNGSTWTQFSTTAGTSASTTVTGLSPNTTYNVKVRARRQYNQVYGTSGTSSVKTIGNSVLNSVSTVTADNSTVSFTINTTVYVPSYTHKLEIKNGNTSILTKTGLTLASGNNTITLTSSERTTLLNAMANIKNFTGTFNLSTWSGSTQIGSTTSKTATVQTTVANSAPTFTGFTYVDGNSTSIAVTENNQILIGGVSTITVTANAATAKNSATIKSYSLVFGSTTASSTTTTITTGTITNTGTVALTVSAVDSRGYSTSQTVNVTSLPYSKIVFKTNSLRRVNEVENTIQLAFTGEMKDITISNVDKNSVQVCQYRYKKTSDQNYGNWTSIVSGVTRSGNNLSYTNDSLTTLDANYSWNVQVNITDRLTSDTITLTVGQGTPLMSWRTKKVGINQKNPSEALDTVGNATFTGTVSSSYKSASWVNSLTNSAFNVPDAANSYGGWICGPTKDGRIAISTYQANDNNLYFGYGERGRTTNSFVKQMKWTGTNGFLTIDGSFITNFSGTGSYNEGIRINKGSNNWSTLHMGGTGESGSGAGQWGFFVNHTSYARRLMIGHGSSSTNTYFSARSDSQTSPDLVCGNTTVYGTGSNGGLNSMLVGDDCYLGDCNVGGHLGLKAVSGDSCGIKCYNNGGTLRGGITFNNGTVDIYYNGTQHRLGCTQLYSGSLAPTGQCSWANYANYDFYIIQGTVDGSNYLSTGTHPRVRFSSGRNASSLIVMSDNNNWMGCYLYYSGTTGYCYMEAGNSNARVKYIFGVN